MYTNLPQSYEKKMNYANIFAKKCRKNNIFDQARAKPPHKESGKSLLTRRLPSYPEPGSNRHGLLHWCLRPARLPIPPSGRARGFLRNPHRLPPASCASLSESSPAQASLACAASESLAERGGFEPPVRLPVRQFSKLLVSATHPSLRLAEFARRAHSERAKADAKVQQLFLICKIYPLCRVCFGAKNCNLYSRLANCALFFQDQHSPLTLGTRSRMMQTVPAGGLCQCRYIRLIEPRQPQLTARH